MTAEKRLHFTERILSFPVRAAAVDAFLRELKARGSGDLNGVLTTLNDGGLCRDVLRHWLSSQWIVVAPHSPLLAIAGPGFSRDLTLREFCGEAGETGPAPESTEIRIERAESKGDENP